MNITFLYHSSFLVELSGCTLLFDWYGGPVPDYDRSKPLYVFASHHHGDHYAPEIFAQLGMDNVWYVLANCIRLSAKRKAALGIDDSHVFRLAAGRHLSLGGLEIQTYRSTDAGVAFLVEEKPSSTQGTCTGGIGRRRTRPGTRRWNGTSRKSAPSSRGNRWTWASSSWTPGKRGSFGGGLTGGCVPWKSSTPFPCTVGRTTPW